MTGHEELLTAVRDVLDVPYGATPDGHVSHRDILVGRAGAVRDAIDAVVVDGRPAAEQAAWLRRYVAEHEPVPDDYVSHVEEASS